MSWILEHWQTIAAIVGGLVSVASLIVGLTPTPKDDAALKAIRDFLIRISILTPSDADGTFKVPMSGVKK